MHRPKQRIAASESDNNLTAFVKLVDPIATNLLLLAITDEQRFIRVDKDNGRHFGIRGNEIMGLSKVTLPNLPTCKFKYCELVQFETYDVKIVKSDVDEQVMRVVNNEFNNELSANIYETTGDYILQPIIGQAVAAKSLKFNKWLRAEIIEVQMTTAKVEYVDLKLREQLPISRFRRILDEHAQVQVYAFKFSLFGIVNNEGKEKERFNVMNTIRDLDLKAWIMQSSEVKQVILYSLNNDRMIVNSFMITAEAATELIKTVCSPFNF